MNAGPVQRTGTPSTDQSSTSNVAVEEATLTDCAAVVADIRSLELIVAELWTETIQECLPIDEDEVEEDSPHGAPVSDMQISLLTKHVTSQRF